MNIAQPIYHPKQVVPRRDQLAVAHGLAKQLGLETRLGKDRTAYENKLESLISKRSLKGATRAERNTVVQALEAELAEREMLRPVRADWVTNEEALEVLGL